MSNSNAQVQRTNGLSIAALVTGIIGASVLAIIFGHIALSQIKTRNEGGRGMAIAGLVLGYVFLGITMIWIIIIAAAASASSSY
jgi:hypothetical protein